MALNGVRCCFAIWRGAAITELWGAVHGFAAPFAVWQHSALVRQADALHAKYKAMSRLHTLVLCQEAADRLEGQLLPSDPKKLYAGVRALVPPKQVCGIRFANKDGVTSQSAAEEQRVVRDHLADALSGVATTFEAAVIADRARIAASRARFATMPRAAAAVPSLVATVRALARAKCKAIGEDGIGGDLCRATPLALGRLLHPLLVNASLLCAPPTQWKRVSDPDAV